MKEAAYYCWECYWKNGSRSLFGEEPRLSVKDALGVLEVSSYGDSLVIELNALLAFDLSPGLMPFPAAGSSAESCILSSFS